MKSFAISVWFVLFATSAAAGDRYANVHSVAIVSVIGDFVAMSNDSVFTGTENACLISTSDWRLDDAITERIGALLSPRFAVKSVTFDRAQLFNLRDSERNLRRYITTLPTDNGVDAYIIVSKRYLTASAGHAPEIFGLTVLNRAIGGPGVFALYKIDVFDAKSGKQLAFAFGHTGVGMLNFTEVVEDVDKSYWSATPSEFSAEQKQKLKSLISRITLNSLPYALYTADLIPNIPPVTPVSSSP